MSGKVKELGFEVFIRCHQCHKMKCYESRLFETGKLYTFGCTDCRTGTVSCIVESWATVRMVNQGHVTVVLTQS